MSFTTPNPTWDDFLRLSLSNLPTVHCANVNIVRYTAHFTPEASEFLRQSSEAETPIRERAVHAFQGYLIRKGKLHEPLPEDVKFLLAMFEESTAAAPLASESAVDHALVRLGSVLSSAVKARL